MASATFMRDGILKSPRRNTYDYVKKVMPIDAQETV